MEFKLFIYFMAPMLLGVGAQKTMRPKALVYRDSPRVTCEDCPETIARMLESSPTNFDVSFAGPKDMDVNKHTLKGVTVFAFPGGPGELSL
jgi:hypothetical protein